MSRRRIYAGRKYPHVYTLSISTGKNQSTKARGALYILTYEYNYKVIIRCDTIVQEYYITDSRKCEDTKRYTCMNFIKKAQSHNRKTLEPSKGPERMVLQTVCWESMLQLRHSDQQLGESTRIKLQDLDMRIQRSSNSPASGDAKARWRAEISTRVSVSYTHLTLPTIYSV